MTGIWKDTIGYDPYAAEGEKQEKSETSYEQAKGLMALAKLSNKSVGGRLLQVTRRKTKATLKRKRRKDRHPAVHHRADAAAVAARVRREDDVVTVPVAAAVVRDAGVAINRCLEVPAQAVDGIAVEVAAARVRHVIRLSRPNVGAVAVGAPVLVLNVRARSAKHALTAKSGLLQRKTRSGRARRKESTRIGSASTAIIVIVIPRRSLIPRSGDTKQANRGKSVHS
ncbi:unnamed protein product [Phytophthora lilii]|uniref:Unnamed protein product n=1 Tax=Phytophthora lilii TaxID=2077276 RepID=A0A9W6TJ92_9STRA|nr:unnamed protein product [Phytophthora lilii]